MRRTWLTLFLAFAVAASGVASAAAAFACPNMQAQAAVHDCCPGDAPPDDGDSKQSMDCALAQMCRTALAMTPLAEPLAIAAPVLTSGHSPLADASPAIAPARDFWRPPRTL